MWGGRGWISRAWLPWVGLFFCLLMTVSTWRGVHQAEQRRITDRFQAETVLIRERIVSRMAALEQILRGASAFVAERSGLPTRGEWRQYVHALELDRLNPGVQGLGFSEWIPAGQMEAHVRRIRAEGFPDYEVRPGGALPPEGGVSAIVYLEPFDERNQRAFSRDMYAERIRRKAMSRARDTGLVSLTGLVKLYQEGSTQIQAGTLLYAPIYRRGLPLDTVTQRQQAFLGWAYMPFRMQNLMESILGPGSRGIALELHDGEAESEASLLFTRSPDPTGQSAPWLARERFEVAGQVWTLRTAPRAGFSVSLGEGAHQAVLLTGVVSSLAILLLLLSLARAERRASALADERSAKLQMILDSTAEAIYGMGPRGECTFVNKACLRMLGYDDPAALLGQDMHRLIHHTRADGRPYPSQACPIQQAFLQGRGSHADDEVLWRADGTSFPAEYWSYPQLQDGAWVGAVVTFVDISARIQVQQKLKESESNFHAFFETVDDMIMVATPEGQLLYCNKAVPAKLGYPLERLADMHVLDLHPLEVRQEAEAIYAAMFRGEQSTCPLPLGTEGGGRIPVETRVWFGQWDGKACIFGVSKDLQRQEAVLQKFNRLFENNPAAMAVSSGVDHCFTEVNAAFCKKLGYTRSEVIGKSARDLGLFADPAEQEAVSQQLLTKGRITDTELQIRTKAGQILLGLFSGEVIDNQDGRHFLTVMVDVTEQRRDEAEIRRQQALIRSLLDSIPDLVFFKDLQGVYLGCNPPFAAYVGRPAQDIIGRTDHDLLPAEVADGFRQQDRLMLQALEPRHNDEWITYPDGHRVLLDTLKTPFYGPQGELLGILGISRDITARMQAEERGRELQQRLTHALEVTGDGIWDWQITTGHVEHNARWCEILGLGSDFLQHDVAAFSERIHEEDRAAVMDAVTACLEGRAPYQSRHRMRQLEGGIVWVMDRGNVVERDPAGRPLRMVGAMADITALVESEQEQKAAEEELRAANLSLEAATRQAQALAAEANAANVAKSEFLANMSHELRTPLNGVIGMVGLLLASPLDAKQRRHAESARVSGESLLAVINDILDLSKVEAGKLQLEEVDFDLPALLGDLELAMAPRAADKGLSYNCSPAPGLPRFLQGDPVRLRQVLLNLVGNAIKFTRRGYVELRVNLEASVPGELLLRFTVRDSGMGIPAGKLASLFQNFSQVDSSISRKFGGTGLGLSISRQLVALLGGQIGVTSQEGQGSEFWFTARLRPGQPPPPPAPVNQDRAIDFHQARLLLVEDNSVNQELGLAILEPWNLQVDVAAHGLEALQALRRTPYDLVLMDVQMPEMDGLEATRTLRNPDSGVLNPGVPVIAMTAHAMQEDRQRCLAAGMNDYLVKPMDPAALLRALEQHLGTPAAPAEAPAAAPPPPSSPGSGPVVFDETGFLSRLMGNRAAAARIVQAFLEDMPRRLERLQEALGAEDPERLTRELHTIKGACAALGGEAMRSEASHLEQRMRQGDLQGVREGIPALLAALAPLRKALETWNP